MGEAFGEQFRDDIRGLAESRTEHLVRFVQRYAPGRDLSSRALRRLVSETVEAHRACDSSIWEEFSGIARGSGLTIEQLLIGNGLTDYRDYVLFDSCDLRLQATEHLGECSAFMVPAALADGHPLVGQTWDMNSDAGQFIVVVHRRPVGAPQTLGLTTVGCLCLIGMNDEGVSVGNTNLIPVDARPGVNYLFTITKALQCSTAAAAADCIVNTQRLSGHNFYAADESEAINIETTACQSVRRTIEHEVFVHTNHYLEDDLKPLEFSGQDGRNSTWRQDRLAVNFAALQAPISAADGWRQLADNTRGDGAVCNEDTEGVHGGFCTVATVVQSPAERQLLICAGGARLGQRQEFTF